MLIGIALVTTTAIGSIALYKSYAIYKEEKNYNVIQGIIPDFDYDVKVAIKVDSQEDVEEVPGRNDGNGGHYKVDVNCENDGKEIKGTWDYNAWNLKIDNPQSGTKCKLQFTSNLSDDEYNNYIQEGITLRRSMYRGKDITESVNSGSFYESIKEGTFDDIFVGDYIKTTANNQEITWLIADIDNYMNTGDTAKVLTQHHVTIIPAEPLDRLGMNLADTTNGGYAGSNMVKIVSNDNNGTALSKDELGKGKLDDILKTYITCDNCIFKNYVIEYRTVLTTAINETSFNRMGDSAKLGASSKATWFSRKLDLMSEVNVYGTTIASSSMYDTGIDNQQYALFKLKPEFINSYNKKRINCYWLKDVASKADFSFADDTDPIYMSAWHANFSGGIRPRFLVGGETQSN